MGKGKLTQFDFSRGEIAPTFYGRADLAQYYQSCSLLENFFTLPEGGAGKMPGTVYAGSVKTSDKKTRLIHFILSDTESYTLEFGHNYIRYWGEHSQIESGGSPVETVSPYAEADLFELKYIKIENSLYIVHRNYAPRKLTFTSSTSWALSTITFTGVLFNASGDYPGAIGFFEQRLVLASTTNDPQRIWMSKTGSYSDFTVSNPITDSDRVILDLNGQRNYQIQWVESGAEILLGCFGGEVILSGSGSPITPTNYQLRYQTGFGSCKVQGKLFNDSILFLQRNANILRDYFYQNEQAAYQSPEVTFFAKHILKTGVIDVALMSDPMQVYWTVLGNGEIVGIAYNKMMQITGAYRLITDGFYESITIVPGSTQDEIWAVVRREINGSTVRYIEYFKPFDFENQEDAFYVHSGKTFHTEGSITNATQANPVVITSNSHGLSNGDTVYLSNIGGMTELNGKRYEIASVTPNTFELLDTDGTGFSAYISGGIWELMQQVFTGLEHLEGKTVDVSIDGGAIGVQTITGGQVDIGRRGRMVHIGLHYKSLIKTVRLESGPGTVLNKRRISQIGFRFYRSLGGKAGASEDNCTSIISREAGQLLGVAPELISGDKNLDIQGDWDESGIVYFIHDVPLPCTVLAMIFEIIISER